MIPLARSNAVDGSGTGVTARAGRSSTARATPAVRNSSDEGRSVAVRVVVRASKRVSSAINCVGDTVAAKTALRKVWVVENCRRVDASKKPSPISPKIISLVAPSPNVKARELLVKISSSVTGKSGRRAKLPVKLEMPKAFNPGTGGSAEGSAGMKLSKDTIPTGVALATVKEINTHPKIDIRITSFINFFSLLHNFLHS